MTKVTFQPAFENCLLFFQLSSATLCPSSSTGGTQLPAFALRLRADAPPPPRLRLTRRGPAWHRERSLIGRELAPNQHDQEMKTEQKDRRGVIQGAALDSIRSRQAFGGRRGLAVWPSCVTVTPTAITAVAPSTRWKPGT